MYIYRWLDKFGTSGVNFFSKYLYKDTPESILKLKCNTYPDIELKHTFVYV